MRQIAQQYKKATSIAGFGKFYTTLSALVVLWLINAIVGKDGLGLIMSAYALSFILGAMVAGWAQAIIMYHVSRHGEDNANARKAGACLFYTLLLGLVVAAGITLAAPWMAGLMGKPGAVMWLQGISWLIPALALNRSLIAWHRARQDVTRMVLYFEIWPASLRLVAFCTIFLFGLPAWMIAPGYVLAFLLPFAILYMRRPFPITTDFRHIQLWDLRHGGQASLNQILNRSVNNLAIFLLSFMASAGHVAEFALGLRVAQFLQFPKSMLEQLQVPRMGCHLQAGDYDQLRREFDLARVAGLCLALAGVAVLIPAGPYLLDVFGDYQAAYALILLLCLASIIRVGFGALGSYLMMAGYAGRAFIANVAAFAVLLASIAGLVPVMGAQGAALSMVISALVMMLMMAMFTCYTDGLLLQQTPALLATFVSVLVVLAYIYTSVPGLIASLVLAVLVVLLAFYARNHYFKFINAET